MRAPVDTISAPPFPRDLEWVNVAPLRMDKQAGRPVLIEFWDCCRPNSLRTLPYVRAWHERYSAAGLRVISVHTPGFAASRDGDAVRAAVARLGIEHPVCIDSDGLVWSLYDNEGWPARYLFDQAGRLCEYHFGEGAYVETELAIQELLGIESEPLRPLRPEDEPSARVVVPSEDVAGPYSGPYVAGTVWAILAGRGEVRAGSHVVAVDGAGAYELVSHPVSTEGVLDVSVGAGVECVGVCFSPGLAPPGP
jgi:hypothetical protein